jgi:uncharacterized protein with PIN domain
MKVVPALGNAGPLRFLVDEHLGRLGRHLRLAGFDTLDSPHFPSSPVAQLASEVSSDEGDQKLLDIAKETHRVLLTKDQALVARALKQLVSVHSVQAVDLDSQFREVLQAHHALEVAASGVGFLSRCLDCNSKVHRVPRELARERVPADIAESQTEFFSCQRCERMFWKGSHYERMRQWLEKVTKSEKSSEK